MARSIDGLYFPSPPPPDSSERHISLPHLPGLDGLRGVAVALVVVYHLSPEALPGGFLGVDIFFVLSGFLITSLAITEVRRRESFRVVAFYGRRIRRLLPALLLLLLAGALYSAVWADRTELDRLREHSLWTLGYLANWRFIADGTTYTDVLHGQSPLRHTWSLAIEEQFYILFPLVVVGLGTLVRWRAEALRWAIGVVAVVGALASTARMVALWDDLDPWRGYFGTDTRAHSLLVGVLLGVVLVGRPVQRGAAARWAAAGAIVGALVLGAAVATSHESSSGLQHGGFLGVAVATAAVIAGSERVQPLNWVLTRRVLVGLGLISYGVYLWHWPVIVILDEPRTGLEGLPLALLRIGVTLTVALASYVLVEQPIRRSRRARVPARVGVAMSAAGVGTVAAFVLLATVVPPVPPAPPRTTTSLSAEVAAANELPVPMLMFGDSVARSLAGGGGDFKEWVPEQSVFDPTLVQLWNVATIYCSFLDGYQVMGDGRTNENAVFLCGDWKRWVEEVLVTDDYKFVLVALANDAGPRLVDDEVVELGTPGHQALLDDFLDELRSVSNQHGAELAVITLPPRTQRGTTVIDEDEDRERLMREEIRRYAEDRPGIRVLDLFEEICPNSECYSPEFDPSWRTDGLHYSTEGARWVADWITEQLVDVDAPASSSAAASRSVAPR